MTPTRHLISVRVTDRARDMLRALADQRGGIDLGRVAGDLLEMALDGRMRVVGRGAGLSAVGHTADAVRGQQEAVLRSLRRAVGVERERP